MTNLNERNHEIVKNESHQNTSK